MSEPENPAWSVFNHILFPGVQLPIIERQRCGREGWTVAWSPHPGAAAPRQEFLPTRETPQCSSRKLSEREAALSSEHPDQPRSAPSLHYCKR